MTALDTINLPLILLAALIASASPGPATLAIAGTSMRSGRAAGLAVACGITLGSWCWSAAAALGLGAVMLANGWILEVVRYAGACYLLYLAYKSAKSAIVPSEAKLRSIDAKSLFQAFRSGYFLHLTNPKAILFFGSLYSIGIPANTPPMAVLIVVVCLGLQSMTVNLGYAFLFSVAAVAKGYARFSRAFNAVFSMAFGAAGVKILMARLT